MANVQEERHLIRSAPYFLVADIEKAATYYETVLGFRRDYTGGSPSQFVILSRDDLAIMLRLVSDPATISPNEQQGGTWDVFFWVNDADELCEEFKSKAAELVYGPIIQTEYNMKEFAVRDIDGYVLGFGQDMPA